MTTLVAAKPWYLSRVIWVNLLAIVAAVVTALSESIELSPELASWGVAILAAINAVLRILTTQPVSASAGEVKEVQS